MESDEDSSSPRSQSSEDSGDVSPRGRVIDSTSYIVPGNPLAPLYENRLTPYTEPLAPIPRQTLHGIHADSSSHRMSRKDTPTRMEHDPHEPAKRREKKMVNDFILPDIGPPNLSDSHLRTEEILDGLNKEGLLQESRFIRHTRSGIAYHFMYGPPTKKPRRLPRIVSEGGVRQKQLEENYVTDPIDYKARIPRRQVNSMCYCSGGRFTEDIRCAAVRSRQEREKKNTERVRSKLQLQNDKLTRMAKGTGPNGPYDERAARVQEVTAKQVEIRQQESRKMMEQFIKQKKRKN